MMNKRIIIGILSIILIFSCIYSVYCETDEATILKELEEEKEEVKKEVVKKEGRNKNKKKNSEKSENDEEEGMKDDENDNVLYHIVSLFNSENAMQKVAEYIEQNPDFARDLQQLSEKIMTSLSFVAAEDLQNAVLEGNKDILSEVQNVLESLFHDNKMKSVLEKFVEICLSAYDGENLNPETIREIKNVFLNNNHNNGHNPENNNKKKKNHSNNILKKSKKGRKEINDKHNQNQSHNGIVDLPDTE